MLGFLPDPGKVGEQPTGGRRNFRGASRGLVSVWEVNSCWWTEVSTKTLMCARAVHSHGATWARPNAQLWPWTGRCLLDMSRRLTAVPAPIPPHCGTFGMSLPSFSVPNLLLYRKTGLTLEYPSLSLPARTFGFCVCILKPQGRTPCDSNQQMNPPCFKRTQGAELSPALLLKLHNHHSGVFAFPYQMFISNNQVRGHK